MKTCQWSAISNLSPCRGVNWRSVTQSLSKQASPLSSPGPWRYLISGQRARCLARELRRGGHIPGGRRRAGFCTTAVTNHAGPRRRPIRSESYAYLLPVAGLQPSTNWSRKDIADRRPGRWLSKVWLGNGAADTFCWPRLRERLEVVVGRSPSGGSLIEFYLVSVRRTARVLECKLV